MRFTAAIPVERFYVRELPWGVNRLFTFGGRDCASADKLGSVQTSSQSDIMRVRHSIRIHSMCANLPGLVLIDEDNFLILPDSLL